MISSVQLLAFVEPEIDATIVAGSHALRRQLRRKRTDSVPQMIRFTATCTERKPSRAMRAYAGDVATARVAFRDRSSQRRARIAVQDGDSRIGIRVATDRKNEPV